ncbi:MAG: hypothetical protein KAJ42_07620 [Gemmatimonadetes bacterium]|nr:hypothetical protein [Gemmatimonadota bacterium]
MAARLLLFGAAVAAAVLVSRAASGKDRPRPEFRHRLPDVGPMYHRQVWPGPVESNYSEPSERLASPDELVKNMNPNIVFKDEEESGADRYMTYRARNATNRLAKWVELKWPGVRLRVTEAWDPNNEHTPGSTHYEGRGIDLTTSDRDPAKLDYLAGLATAAGYDWVIHEGNHIHASVRR